MSTLVVRWLPILKRWDLPEDQYEVAAQKLDSTAQIWRQQQPFGLDIFESHRFIREDLRKVQRLFDESLCDCEIKAIL